MEVVAINVTGYLVSLTPRTFFPKKVVELEVVANSGCWTPRTRWRL